MPSAVGTENPLNINAHTLADRCSDRWLVSALPHQIPAPGNDVDGLGKWAKSANGAAADMQRVTLTIDGKSQTEAWITQIRAVVVGSRSEPSDGTVISIGCGEAVSYRLVEANLDYDPPKMTPRVRLSGDNAEGVNVTPIEYPLKVSATEAESFLVESVVSRFDVHYRIAVDWEIQGRMGTTIVGDSTNDNKPFRVSAGSRATRVCTWNEDGILIATQSSKCALN